MSRDLITVDAKELERLVIKLKGLPISMQSAVQNALNRSMQNTKNKVIVYVRTEYKLIKPSQTFRMWVVPAKAGDLSAGIGISGHVLSIARFGFTPVIPGSSSHGLPVRVRIKAKDSYKAIGVTPKAFIASTGAKSAEKIKVNVFHRQTAERLPISVIRTLSVPQMVGNDDVAERITEFAMEKLEQRVDYEMERAMNRISKKKG